MTELSDNMRGSALMAAAMAGFTLNDACMKALTTGGMPLFQAILLRGLGTLAALLVIARLSGGLRLRFSRPDMAIIGVRSVGEVGGTLLFLIALMHMPLANLSAILQSLPLAMTLAAALIFREPIGWRRMAAIGVGFVGVLLIVRPGTVGFDRWALIGIGSVAFVVIRDLSTRRLSRAVPSVSVAFYAALVVTSMAAIAAPFGGWSPVGLREALLVLSAAGFLIAGYLCVVMAMRVGEIGIVAPFRYAALLWAIGLGWFVFGDWPDPLTLLGAAIIIATGVYTFYRERRLGQRLTMPKTVPLRIR